MKINTNEGVYYLERFHADETYGGLYAGKITKELNIEFINRIEQEWRGLPCTIISPDENLINSHLPIHECYAILTSEKVLLDQDAHGSQVFIKWYSDLEHDLPTEINKIFPKINWSVVAEDYYL